jgi:hypothetical protein
VLRRSLVGVLLGVILWAVINYTPFSKRDLQFESSLLEKVWEWFGGFL